MITNIFPIVNTEVYKMSDLYNNMSEIPVEILLYSVVKYYYR